MCYTIWHRTTSEFDFIFIGEISLLTQQESPTPDQDRVMTETWRYKDRNWPLRPRARTPYAQLQVELHSDSESAEPGPCDSESH